MNPDEITYRRFPPAYRYKIPGFHFIDKFDPLFSGFNEDITDETKDETEVRAETDSPEMVPNERRGFGKDENPAGKSEGHVLLPSNYSMRITSDRTTIAADIRKYLSSHHLNPIGSSNNIRYDRSFRRLHF